MVTTPVRGGWFAAIRRHPGPRILRFACALAAMGIAPSQAQVSEIVLHNFGGPGGGRPYTGVTSDAAGNLYGTTENGGPANVGVVYKLDGTGHYTVLYSFTGGADGSDPFAGVIDDPQGNLYGTAGQGGTAGSGVVYSLDPTGQYTLLYTFTNGPDGSYPSSGVIRDSEGSLYGATAQGGAFHDGVAYKLDAAGHETVLHSFTGGSDGGGPYGLVGDQAGNLYGTTGYGGLCATCGVVYKLDATRHVTVLYSFKGGADGQGPSAGLMRDSAGNLYGTTSYGGAGAGVVYKLDATGQYTVLYRFTGGADGGIPVAGVIQDPAGNLYGTAIRGGSGNLGVAYMLDAAGQYTVLNNFTGGADGGFPVASLTRGPAGNLYGTAQVGGKFGGKNGGGVLFQLRIAAAAE